MGREGGGVGQAAVAARVVDLQVAERVGREVAVVAREPLQHVVRLLVSLQVALLHRLVLAPTTTNGDSNGDDDDDDDDN